MNFISTKSSTRNGLILDSVGFVSATVYCLRRFSLGFYEDLDWIGFIVFGSLAVLVGFRILKTLKDARSKNEKL